MEPENLPPWAEAHIRALEERTAELRRNHLAPLESGRTRVTDSGVDVTDREIASLKRQIAGLEAVTVQFRDWIERRARGEPELPQSRY